jgi:hypothetical protein
MLRVASLSEDKLYRYSLGRQWSKPAVDAEGKPDRKLRCVTWLMFNPSTADGETDDATIRKCVKFSQRWGFDALLVANLYAYRTPFPKALALEKAKGVDIVGPDNDHAIVHCAINSEGIICAWGTHELAALRVPKVAEYLGRIPLPKMCLGTTNNGSPRHPLYLADDTRPVPFSPWVGRP